MTNFATEINRDITRFLRNKMMINNDTSLDMLLNAVENYLKQLYPNKIYRHNNEPLFAYSCNDKVIVLRFCIDVNEANPINEELFWDSLLKLQSLHSEYKNVDEGFLYFVSNKKEYWTPNTINYSENDNMYSLKGTIYRRLTLYPQTNHIINGNECQIWPCQMTWLPTKDSNSRCCAVTFDPDVIQHNYRPHTKSPANASPLNLVQNFREIGKKTVQSIQEEEGLTAEARLFYKMMSADRFVDASTQLFEWESSFSNDYSRIIMSPAFRRLKDKTQVFSLSDSDFVRVRLTHSLEVANVCKLIGRGIENRLSEKVLGVEKLRIPDVLEVSGLIHDVGNPPFGHFGEKTIQDFFKNVDAMPRLIKQNFTTLDEQQQADLQNFDGNVQGFRIMRHLGLASDCTSFNLNKVILSTLIKYPFSSLEGNDKKSKDHSKRKFGYFKTEASAYADIIRTLGLQEHQRHPLTYLLEAADDIVYKGDDIEDGWKLGYISISDYISEFDKVPDPQFKRIFEEEWDYFKKRLKDDDDVVVEHTMVLMRIKMQRYMIKKCVDIFVERFEDIINNRLGEEQELLMLNDDTKMIHTIWNSLVQSCYDGIHLSQLQGAKIISYLLTTFLETVLSNELSGFKEVEIDNAKTQNSLKRMVYYISTNNKEGMTYEIISNNYRNELSSMGQSVPQDTYSKFLLVTDYISGMTDKFAYNLYNELV